MLPCHRMQTTGVASRPETPTVTSVTEMPVGTGAGAPPPLVGRAAVTMPGAAARASRRTARPGATAAARAARATAAGATRAAAPAEAASAATTETTGGSVAVTGSTAAVTVGPEGLVAATTEGNGASGDRAEDPVGIRAGRTRGDAAIPAVVPGTVGATTRVVVAGVAATDAPLRGGPRAGIGRMPTAVTGAVRGTRAARGSSAAGRRAARDEVPDRVTLAAASSVAIGRLPAETAVAGTKDVLRAVTTAGTPGTSEAVAGIRATIEQAGRATGMSGAVAHARVAVPARAIETTGAVALRATIAEVPDRTTMAVRARAIRAGGRIDGTTVGVPGTATTGPRVPATVATVARRLPGTGRIVDPVPGTGAIVGPAGTGTTGVPAGGRTTGALDPAMITAIGAKPPAGTRVRAVLAAVPALRSAPVDSATDGALPATAGARATMAATAGTSIGAAAGRPATAPTIAVARGRVIGRTTGSVRTGRWTGSGSTGEVSAGTTAGSPTSPGSTGPRAIAGNARSGWWNLGRRGAARWPDPIRRCRMRWRRTSCPGTSGPSCGRCRRRVRTSWRAGWWPPVNC
ncbi:hypothetical protein NUM_40050 [Actinocatenispora comari]|uniref:Uncharacterized protein n=1 Tax=Actinocatenispora comari TaxID=2807577 RepID=A0A8J4ABT8_9ACTN|nr:hypothetical protein NUM_40050 [Actinocatenispora comari]